MTGACGLLGGRLAELLAAAHDVIALRHHAPVPAGLTAVEGDLLDGASLGRALESARAGRGRAQRRPGRRRSLRGGARSRAPVQRRRERRDRPALPRPGRAADRALDGPRASPATRAFIDRGRSRTAPSSCTAAPSARRRTRSWPRAPDAVVLRVALVIGRGYGPRVTASEAVAAALAAGRRPRLFDDQYRTPIDPESVADAIGACLGRTVVGALPSRRRGAAQPIRAGPSRRRRAGPSRTIWRRRARRPRVCRGPPTPRSTAAARDASSAGGRGPLDDAIRDGRRPTV